MSSAKVLLLLSCCLIQISFISLGFAQEEIILKRKIILSSPLPEHLNKGCDYELLLPVNRPYKQEIMSYKYTISPKQVIASPDGGQIAKWNQLSFEEMLKIGLEAEIRLKINNYDLKTAKSKPVIAMWDTDTLKYLKNANSFSFDSKDLKEATAAIIGTTREDVVQEIFDFVIFKLDCKKIQEQRVSEEVVNNNEDCTEYSELMVRLCRMKNIPAREQTGLVILNKGNVAYHSWVEVFFKQYGWVAFDPAWADSPNTNTTFDSMKNVYIQLNNGGYVRNYSSSCDPRTYFYSSVLKDRYELIVKADFTPVPKEQKELYQKMWILYNSTDPVKSLPLLDTLISYAPHYSHYSFKGMVYARTGEFDKGLECLQIALKMAKSKDKNSVLYAFANYFALKEEKEFAVSYLKKAIELGFKQYEHLENDPDFIKIKDYQPFIDLKNELKPKSSNK